MDDGLDFVRMMRIRLEKEGYLEAVASSGEEALAYLDRDPAGVVLLDLFLPRMSGFDVLRELRSRPQTAELPVIIISGQDPSRMEEAPAPFGLDWLVKPFGENRLLRRLHEALQRDKEAIVLVADDDPDIRAILTRFIGRKVIRVETASSGREAVEKCRRSFRDFVVLDLAMPDEDGFYVIGELRRDPELRRIPIVVHSAWEPSPEERRRLAVGTTLYLTKAKTSQEEFESGVVEFLDELLPEKPK